MNPDQAIDRVLTALATTEAPPDLENRVLNTLQTRATTRQDARSQSAPFALLSFVTPRTRHPERSAKPEAGDLSTSSSRPWAIAAALIILSLAASLAVRRRHNPLHAAALKQHPSSPSLAVPQVADVQSAHRTHPSVLAASQQTKNVAAPEDINDLDTLAIIEMNTPSKPAPPLPLTHQEQLLAHAVARVGPEELSSLRPEVRALQMDLSKAEFHNFFEPPPVRGNE